MDLAEAAVKSMNGKKIDGHRILTDIERGRTRPDWRPRRLGKGLGKGRYGPDKSKSENGRDSSRTERDRTSDRDKGYKRRRSRSRSHERRRSRSRDRHRRHRSPDADRNNKRSRKDDMMRQYGEYGAEIRAEYNGDM